MGGLQQTKKGGRCRPPSHYFFSFNNGIFLAFFLLEDDFATAVSPPAILIGFGTDGSLFSVGDGVHLNGDTELLHVPLNLTSTLLTEGEVVLIGATLIAVTFDGKVLSTLVDALHVVLKHGPCVPSKR